MNAKTQEAYRLFHELKDLEVSVAKLNDQRKRLEARLDALFVENHSNVVSLSREELATARRGRVASDNSSKRRIEALLNLHTGVEFDAEMVANETSINLGTVRTNLSRLVREGLIEKRSFNTYGAIMHEKEAPKTEASPTLTLGITTGT